MLFTSPIPNQHPTQQRNGPSPPLTSGSPSLLLHPSYLLTSPLSSIPIPLIPIPLPPPPTTFPGTAASAGRTGREPVRGCQGSSPQRGRNGRWLRGPDGWGDADGDDGWGADGHTGRARDPSLCNAYAPAPAAPLTPATHAMSHSMRGGSSFIQVGPVALEHPSLTGSFSRM